MGTMKTAPSLSSASLYRVTCICAILFASHKVSLSFQPHSASSGTFRQSGRSKKSVFSPSLVFRGMVNPTNHVSASFARNGRMNRDDSSWDNKPSLLLSMTRGGESNMASPVTEWIEGIFGDKQTEQNSSRLGGNENGLSMTAVERYFNAWNRRDMHTAVECFAEDCEYEDTQYPDPFVGRTELRKHLLRIAKAVPSSFQFVLDDLAVSSNGEKIGIQWHVENDGEPLPFARGCSFYEVDGETGLITRGFDVPEPAVIKPGDTGLAVLSLASKIIEEPVRAVPLLLWGAYMYVVFFSDGILPGANALQLEQRTWEEVRDLSLNFFLVAPLLHLPFSPVVHPMLEGVFNLLLSWAAMFAGFLSDERDEKQNLLPMFPIVVGMQFLTSAFLLPFLASRTSEKLEPGEVVYKEDLGVVERVAGESRILGPLLGGVGTGSIIWAFFGRPEFGGWGERYASFMDLLSIDRVGSSFIVDLVLFGLFQGWLVDDDMRRRGVRVDEGEGGLLRGIAKFIPFFGLVAYLSLRPSLPSRTNR